MTPADARLDLRISSDLKECLKQAANAERRSLSSFVIVTLESAVREVWSSETSGWEMWEDARGTRHVKVALTERDAMRMDSAQLAMLEDAGELIQLVFDPATPERLAELRATKGKSRRAADPSADELRDLLRRLQGTAQGR